MTHPPEHAASSALDQLLAEFSALKAQVAAQQAQLQQQAARLHEQERELQTLRQVAATVIAEESARENVIVLPHRSESPPPSRRSVLAGAAAAVAALGLAASAGARPAGAQTPPPGKDGRAGSATGGNMIIGQVNSATAVGDVTLLQNATSNVALDILFKADNWPVSVGQTAAPASTKISLFGGNSYDQADSNAANAAAVAGKNLYGVYGKAPKGTGVGAEGTWPLQIAPSAPGVAPVPTLGTGANLVNAPTGTLYYQRGASSGGLPAFFDPDALWMNWGSPGGFIIIGSTPNYFRRVAAQNSAGVFVPITPVRVLNTGYATATPIGFDQTGAAIATAFQFNVGNNDETRQFRIAGKTFSGVTIPADALGVFGNITIVQSSAGGGFVSVFGGTTAPNVSTVNPSTPIQANSFYSQISSSNLTVRSVGDQARYVIIDIFGYYY